MSEKRTILVLGGHTSGKQALIEALAIPKKEPIALSVAIPFQPPRTRKQKRAEQRKKFR